MAFVIALNAIVESLKGEEGSEGKLKKLRGMLL